jgi:hypothetical protein
MDYKLLFLIVLLLVATSTDIQEKFSNIINIPMSDNTMVINITFAVVLFAIFLILVSVTKSEENFFFELSDKKKCPCTQEQQDQ